MNMSLCQNSKKRMVVIFVLRGLLYLSPLGLNLLLDMLAQPRTHKDINIIISIIVISSIAFKSSTDVILRQFSVKLSKGRFSSEIFEKTAKKLIPFSPYNIYILTATVISIISLTDLSVIYYFIIFSVALMHSHLNVVSAGLRLDKRMFKSLITEPIILQILSTAVVLASVALYRNVELSIVSNFVVLLLFLFSIVYVIIIGPVRVQCVRNLFRRASFQRHRPDIYRQTFLSVFGTLGTWGLILYLSYTLDDAVYAETIIILQLTFFLKFCRNFFVNWRAPVFVKKIRASQPVERTTMFMNEQKIIIVLGIFSALAIISGYVMLFNAVENKYLHIFFVFAVADVIILASSPMFAWMQLTRRTGYLELTTIAQFAPLFVGMLLQVDSVIQIGVLVLAGSVARLIFITWRFLGYGSLQDS